ncbi:TlyA family RNA methyltransferase [Candidatus Puniceispirillum sp.]|nr:TlyA family RNA methyltransferase [Candidatus Puniceispirillum sp.]
MKKLHKWATSVSQSHIQDGKKLRADALLIARGLAGSRERACELIAKGAVLVNGVTVVKPSKLLASDCEFMLTAEDNPWVSRASLKLAGGLEAFPMIDVSGRYAIDIGAGTGGFTEVLLAQNVRHVLAVDVGSGQLAEKVATDPRVTVMDKTNARHLKADALVMPIDLIVCDASFISLKKVLPAVMSLSNVGTYILALVKPQFEVGKGMVGKGGIVRDTAMHAKVVADIENWLINKMKWQHIGTVPSPIFGVDGNQEFLLAACKVG